MIGAIYAVSGKEHNEGANKTERSALALGGGGMRSVNNDDLARGCQRVVILSPSGLTDLGAFGNPRVEVALLKRAGCRAEVVVPCVASIGAIGPNVLDPAHRAASAPAGGDRGRAVTATLHTVCQAA